MKRDDSAQDSGPPSVKPTLSYYSMWDTNVTGQYN